MEEIKNLIQKDIILEWRQKYAFNGMVLYVISTVFLCYMSFKLKTNQIEPITWNTLFWIIILFSAVNSVTKSFTQENAGRHLYYYQIAKPESIIIAKIVYNFILLLFLGLLGMVIYFVFMGNPVENMVLYTISIVLGALGFSAIFTLIAGIAAKSDNTSGIMAVLSFPIVLPMLSMLIKLSKNALDGLALSASYDEIMVILGIDFIVISLSYLLFPYLWKS
ncbi:heme exporter protein CcmB [Lacihabitans lacunae]|jgi:heme exporter protein B|uniref:Heme exporter protein CcmB n=1 Tax=Lacihabitans lacunae TaxID=1028214 RepID=A0ABV7YU75_9BACT